MIRKSLAGLLALCAVLIFSTSLLASSHREEPLISPSLVTQITPQEIENLPNPGRNFSDFANMTPNVHVDDTVGQGSGYANVVIRREGAVGESFNPQLGSTLGGPLIKDKLWFFGNFSTSPSSGMTQAPISSLLQGGFVDLQFTGRDNPTGYIGDLNLHNNTGDLFFGTMPNGTNLIPNDPSVQRMSTSGNFGGPIFPGSTFTTPLNGFCNDHSSFPPPATFSQPLSLTTPNAQSSTTISDDSSTPKVDLTRWAVLQSGIDPSKDFYITADAINLFNEDYVIAKVPGISTDYLTELATLPDLSNIVDTMIQNNEIKPTGLPSQMNRDTTIQWSTWLFRDNFDIQSGEKKIEDQVEQSGGSQTSEQIQELNENIWGNIRLVNKKLKENVVATAPKIADKPKEECPKSFREQMLERELKQKMREKGLVEDSLERMKGWLEEINSDPDYDEKTSKYSKSGLRRDIGTTKGFLDEINQAIDDLTKQIEEERKKDKCKDKTSFRVFEFFEMLVDAITLTNPAFADGDIVLSLDEARAQAFRAIDKALYVYTKLQHLTFDLEKIAETPYAKKKSKLKKKVLKQIRTELGELQLFMHTSKAKFDKTKKLTDKNFLEVRDINGHLYVKGGAFDKYWRSVESRLEKNYAKWDDAYLKLLERSEQSKREGKDYLADFNRDEAEFFKVFSRVKLYWLVLEKIYN